MRRHRGSSRWGLIVQPDGYAVTHRRLIIELTGRHLLPAIYTFRSGPVEGGLVSYGADIPDQFRRVADYVDGILKGRNPSERRSNRSNTSW
jgi:putative tryptophan/tyrosine transport system substrate-binding protein